MTFYHRASALVVLLLLALQAGAASTRTASASSPARTSSAAASASSGSSQSSGPAPVFNCVGGSVYVIAHPDDDLLFQSPDLYTDVAGSNCITVVILTAGDSGTTGSTYALSREQGNAAAYAKMAGVSNVWTEFTSTFGGQPILVTTLKQAPQVQRVHFRFPDGNMDGSGFATTGYQSLRNLYFGSISQIRNQPGTATFSLATLKQALAEIITARQPSYVRTLDYLSDYDAGDHADHLTVGRIASDVAGKYAANASVAGYMGYPVQNLPPTMGLDDSNFKSKCDAFFAYTPFDYAECQSLMDCYNAGRGETYWLMRQYAVTEDLAERSYMGTAQSPVTLPNGTNVAPLGQALASSQSDAQPASAAIDGNIQGYPGNSSAEWSSAGETTTAWWGVLWPDTYNITSVALYDRPNQNDWITGGTLTFSDGSSVPFGALANDGSATLITLAGPVITSYIKMDVTSVSTSTGAAGLAEFRAFGTECPGCTPGNSFGDGTTTTETAYGVTSGTDAYNDLALSAEAYASSSFAQQGPEKAIDGVIDGYPGQSSAEWASYGETVGAWLNVTWNAYYLVDSLVLWDRPNDNDWITGGTIAFSDGSSLPVGPLNNDGSATVYNLSTPVNISSLRLSVTGAGPSSSSVGLAEIGAFYSLAQTPINITSGSQNPGIQPPVVGDLDDQDWDDDLALQNATATASSQSPGQEAIRAISGDAGGYVEDGSGDYTKEWASAGEGASAWFNISWPYAIRVEQVSLYDRPNMNDQITGAILRFDNGQYLSTGPLNNDGSPTNISIPNLVTTSIKMVVTAVSPTTNSVGLSEFAVYGSVVNSTSTSTGSLLNNGTVASNSTLAGNGTVIGNTTLLTNGTLIGNTTLLNNGSLILPNGTVLGNSSVLLPNSTLLLPNSTLLGNGSVVLGNGSVIGLNISGLTNSSLLPNGTIVFSNGTSATNISAFLPNATASSLYGSATLNATSSGRFNTSASITSFFPSSTASLSANASRSLNSSAASSTLYNSSAAGPVSTGAFNISASASGYNMSGVFASSTAASGSATASASRNASSSFSGSSAVPTASPSFLSGSASLNASISVSPTASASRNVSSSASASSASFASSASSALSASMASASSVASASLASASSVALRASASSLASVASSLASIASSIPSASASATNASASAVRTASASSSSLLPNSTSTTMSSTQTSSTRLSSSTLSSSASSASSSGMVTITRSSSASSTAIPSSSSSSVAPSSTKSAALPTSTTGASVNIARINGVVATASSSISKSPPSGAIDGNNGGVSALGFGNAAQEWVANGKQGQWIELALPANYLLREVVLRGRVNTWSSITSGVLNFTDGTTIKVGAVSPSGSSVSLGSGIAATGMRFTITGTSYLTTQAGLAEIELYNREPPTSGLIGSLGNAVGSTVGSILGLFGLA
ncbi:hypothetical protein Rhopal_000783-T1 [Rhodotorula paludigena]|uniref:N-acetylglucosaminylphosphatidylinositol deacetylase n=1 Tax=Rhodotorula paludigena TaxID=86838 RepID=A0AAV5GC11_9BASI|nr:hypothetical protein Rhopal_000783-T1 [Rhodotorula paludigena]